ncbi:hypothetical protein OS493_027256 [Desmophyllum pertusum]|uniref:OTU domain-containing protein n=1 Tax=Desmophyllum pertusum TaxID=174260 RepID=A0A9W9ZCQ4_9CNID|nr:hypothetical protein OS493_027256 [Desmophyllum pertusum]
MFNGKMFCLVSQIYKVIDDFSLFRSNILKKIKLNQSFRRSRELQQDLLAQYLIPCDAPTNLIARKVVGDGNCLFNAISLSLVDNGPHYHNTAFLLYLCEVNLTFNLTLVEYNNFEAGEGKSMLDTHFSMTNVKCRKLQINRSKAPDKVGTLKDISLYGSFQFPKSGTYSGGLIARSLSAVGKELKKTKVQIQALSSMPQSQ